MRPTHEERLLLAAEGQEAAFWYRQVAEARLMVCEDEVRGYSDFGDAVPADVAQALRAAKREFLELERITQLYLARDLDAYRHEIGEVSDFESEAILHDVLNPIGE